MQNKFTKYFIFFIFNTTFCHYKIAFVKQVVYQDLYCTSSDASIKEIILSSFKRSGPVALFTKFNADFFIVDVEPDMECNIWKEKCPHQGTIKDYESLKTEISSWGKIAGHKYSQGHYSIRCDQIDWSKYDIVIALDTAVPARITRKFPKTLWAYYVGEGVQPSFYRSFKTLVSGYDVFLNQDCNLKNSNASHVIEFPYHLQYFGCFNEALEINKGIFQRKGAFLESHTNMYFDLNKKELNNLENVIRIINYNSRMSLYDMILNHFKTKYFIQFVDPKSKIRSGTRGNAAIQAIASGNLVIAKKGNISNKDILTPKTIVNSFQELISTIQYFEKNPKEFEKELKIQRRNLNYLCFERPINQLFEKARLKKLRGK